MIITIILIATSLTPQSYTQNSYSQLVGTKIDYYVKGSIEKLGSIELDINITILAIDNSSISASFRVEVLEYSGDLKSTIEKLEINIPDTVVDKLLADMVAEYEYTLSRYSAWFIVPVEVLMRYASILLELNNTVVLAANIGGVLGVVAWDKETRITRYIYMVEEKPEMSRELEIVLRGVESNTFRVEPPSSSEITSFKKYMERAPIIRPPTVTIHDTITPVDTITTIQVTVTEVKPLETTETISPSGYTITYTYTETIERVVVSTTTITQTTTVVEELPATQIALVLALAIALVLVVLLARQKTI